VTARCQGVRGRIAPCGRLRFGSAMAFASPWVTAAHRPRR
jgi:hypothetical protein